MARKYGYLWVTLAFFLISAAGHFLFAWFAYVNEQEAHSQPIVVSEYFVATLRDTLENWQSEFLQLMWQVAGLSILLYVGSPQSKEEVDRTEAKIDFLMQKVAPDEASREMERLEKQYPKK